MSNSNNRPTTIRLVDANRELRNSLPSVTTGQIFGMDGRFDPNGLYSVEIFGEVGSEERNKLRAKVDLNCQIFNPTIHRILGDLGSLYIRIMEGNETAIFDEKLKDFVPSSDPKAETGFTFFKKHFPNIRYRRTQSRKRDQYIKFIYKYLELGRCFTDFMPVPPAGLRDYQANDNGRAEEDEINDLYKVLISRASLVDPTRAKSMPEVFDNNFMGIQKAANDIDMYIEEYTKGDTKLTGKVSARKIFNTTSNVISSHVEKSKGLRDPKYFRFNEVRIPLYQFLRGTAPLSVFNIKLKYMSKMMSMDNNTFFLTDMKTNKRVEVSVRSIRKDLDLWLTNDGLDKTMAYIGNIDVRMNPVIFKGETPDGKKGVFTLGLLYKSDKYFKFFQDIDDVPEEYLKIKHEIKPVSLFEFVYMSVYAMNGKYPSCSTRYPVTGEGSIFPANAVITTTIETDTLRELDETWTPYEGPDYLAINFPRQNGLYINTMVIPPAHIAGLGADFDGDQAHSKIALSTEAREEVDVLLGKKSYYVSDDGKAIYSRATNVLDAVIKTLSR